MISISAPSQAIYEIVTDPADGIPGKGLSIKGDWTMAPITISSEWAIGGLPQSLAVAGGPFSPSIVNSFNSLKSGSKIEVYLIPNTQKKTRIFSGTIVASSILPSAESGSIKLSISAICKSADSLHYLDTTKMKSVVRDFPKSTADSVIVNTCRKSGVTKVSDLSKGKLRSHKGTRRYPMRLSPLKIIRSAAKEGNYYLSIYDDKCEFTSSLNSLNNITINSQIVAVLPSSMKDMEYVSIYTQSTLNIKPFTRVTIDKTVYAIFYLRYNLSKSGVYNTFALAVNLGRDSGITPALAEQAISIHKGDSSLYSDFDDTFGPQVGQVRSYNPSEASISAAMYDSRFSGESSIPKKVKEQMVIEEQRSLNTDSSADATNVRYASPVLYPGAGLYLPVLRGARMLMIPAEGKKDELIPVAMMLPFPGTDFVRTLPGDCLYLHPLSSNGEPDTLKRVQGWAFDADGSFLARGTGVNIEAKAASPGRPIEIATIPDGKIIIGDVVTSQVLVPGSLLVPTGPRAAVRTGDQITVSVAWGAWFQALAAAAGFATPIPILALGEPTTGSLKTLIE